MFIIINIFYSPMRHPGPDHGYPVGGPSLHPDTGHSPVTSSHFSLSSAQLHGKIHVAELPYVQAERNSVKTCQTSLSLKSVKKVCVKNMHLHQEH